MNDFSILIGGKAGDGVNQAGLIIARIFGRLGYRLYVYFDYPSLIRGGHNFSLIRVCKDKITVQRERVDFLLALNQDSIDLHKNKLKDSSFIIYDSDSVKSAGLGLPLGEIIKEENASAVMRNSCLIGAFSKAVGVEWSILESVFNKNISKQRELNLKLARRGYSEAKELTKIPPLPQDSLPLLTGSEAMSLGLLKAGLEAYVAYPMTPSSGVLHFLAQKSEDFSLKVVHPESEIAVILIALGFSYAGERVAVGTSGGGFCLITEGLSLAAIAELPIVIIVSQRPGPSTGVPTYTAQTDLHFVLNAGQGEFPRFVVAPADAEEAYFWSAAALNISWEFQLPAIVLADKVLSEGSFSFDLNSTGELKREEPLLWDRKEQFKRYLDTETGVSPLTFAPDKEAVVKVSSYEHDQSGITTEEAQKIKAMQDKRLRKQKGLIEKLEDYKTVNIYGLPAARLPDGQGRHGNRNSSTALVCWGSNKGVCVEAAQSLGLKVIQPVVLSPFPLKQFRESVRGINRLICVENNATAQIARLINSYGFEVNEKILKYDGRPFSREELEKELKMVIK